MANLQPGISIEKLNQFNYQTWAMDMQYLLLQHNAWDIVTGQEIKPEINKDAGITITNVNDFEKRFRLAQSLIFLNLSPEFKSVVAQCSSSTDAWKVLKNHFQPDSRSRHMQLFTELVNCRIQNGEPINMFAARLRKIVEDLKGINQVFPEIYQSFQLIRYLPEEFDQLTQSILRWPEDKFTFQKILTELIAEETRITLKEQDRANSSQCEVQSTSARPTRSRTPTKKYKNVRKKYFSPNQQPKSITPEMQTRASKSPGRRGSILSKKSVTKGGKTELHYVCEALFTDHGQSNEWVFDTASTHHFCKDRHLFESLEPVNDRNLSVAIKGKSIPIKWRGVVPIKFENERVLYIDRALYVPQLRKNILSGPLLDEEGYHYQGGDNKIELFDAQDKYFFTAYKKWGLYYVPTELLPNQDTDKKQPKTLTRNERQRKNKGKNNPLKPQANKVESKNTTAGSSQIETWHRRVGHVSHNLLIKTTNNDSVRGIPKLKTRNFFCEDCKLNKARRVTFKPVERVKSQKPLDLLHLDLWGPASVKGYRGERYYLSITDDYSRKIALYPLTRKSEAFSTFQKHVTRAERFLSTKLKAIRSDNGKEFDNHLFRKYCEENGVKHEWTDIYSPEMNGVAERVNQTIGNSLRTILNSSKVPPCYWPEAVLYAAYSWNRICRNDKEKTPYELYGGYKPSLKHMRPFGSVCFVGVPKQRRTKFDKRASKGILVGYACRIKGYRILFPDTRKVIESRHVTFAEQQLNDFQLKEQVNSGAVLGSHTPTTTYTFQDDDRVLEIPHVSSFPEQSTSDISSRRPSTSSKIESSSEDSDTDNETDRPLRLAKWEREPIPRKGGSRTDIYYREIGQNQKLNSLKKIKEYCLKNKIQYQPELFDFSGLNKTSGPISPTHEEEPESDQDDLKPNTQESEQEDEYLSALETSSDEESE